MGISGNNPLRVRVRAHRRGARFYQETGGLRQEFFEKCRAEILPFSLDALPAHRNQPRIHTELAQMPSVECGMSKQ